jgi:NAD(P)-dependent dehydrogenase (short-subunit alcohol dehydrogenase family)
MKRLDGKNVIVTGAARGVGRASAIRFAEEGAQLVLLDICRDVPECGYALANASQLEATAQICREQGASALTVHCDIRRGDEVENAVRKAIDRYGAPDVLMNNAGIAAPSGKPLHLVTDEEWDVMIATNLTGAWRMMRAVLPLMQERRSGSVVNVASTAGMVGYRYFSGYVAAKHGLVGLSKAAALDYASFGVRVNALCPGSIKDEPALEGRMLTEIARCLQVPVEDHERAFCESQPMNRLVEAADVANAALWLASDESRQVTGTVVAVDGGFTVR